MKVNIKVNNSPSTVTIQVNNSVTLDSKSLPDFVEPIESVGDCTTPDIIMILKKIY